MCLRMVLYLSKIDELSEVAEFMKKANDKLVSSRLLFDGGQYETIVSVAYYSMFLTAKTLLIKKNNSPKTHECLISEFGRVYVKNGDFSREISKHLSRGQSLRESADYDTYDRITKSITPSWIKNAKKSYKKPKNSYKKKYHHFLQGFSSL